MPSFPSASETFPAAPKAPLRTVILEERRTPFNALRVIQIGQRIDLDVEGATYATWHPAHLLTGYSWDALSLACLLRPSGAPTSVLLLGLGGGTVVRQLRHFCPAAHIVGVEIDDGVVELAQKHMHLNEAAVDVVIGDAYDFLAVGDQGFDVIIDDLFLTGDDDVVRTRAPDGDTLALLRSRLNPGGLVVANLITDVGPHRKVRHRTRAAFRDGFAVTRVVRPPRGLNEILVGGDDVATASAWPAIAATLEKRDAGLMTAMTVKRLR